MASRPSGLRQPSNLRSSNTNLSSVGTGSTAGGGNETPAKPGGSTAIPMSRLASSNSIRRKITTPGIQPPGSRDSGLAGDADQFLIGDTVYVNGDPTKRGKICFIGEVAFAKGDFAGIVLDLPIGNHDGVVQGKRYFQCAPSHGLFTKLSRLTRDPLLESPSTPRAPQSTASSVIYSPDPQPAGAARAMERTPSPSGQRSVKSMSPAVNSSLSIGERVIVASATGGTKIGILRYLGTTEFAAGEWAGVELLTPMGKNNGTVGGKSYFTCKEKHGLFVPASKVISSPVNKTPRRHGSRESLVSVSSLASSAASRSIRRPSMRDSQCLPTCSLQPVLIEKEKHMERLIKERELDRVDLGNLSRQFEEKKLEVKILQSEVNELRQQIQSSNATNLQNALEEEHRKLEDLQYTLDEEKIMKADLQAQLDALTEKLSQKSDTDKVSSEQTRAELEERTKEIESLKKELTQKGKENRKLSTELKESQEKVQGLEENIESLNKKINSLNEDVARYREDKQKLLAAHQEEINAMKKKAADQVDTINTLRATIEEKKRKEVMEEEKYQKLLSEFEAVNNQKCALEAEIVDLVNKKTGTSELLSGKIKDLTEEVQDLRAKLQSTEEDKAVVRRINAEFKLRLGQYEQSEANLKKELEELSNKLAEEKSSSEKQLNEEISNLQSDKQKMQETIDEKDQEIAKLKDKVAKAEESVKTASASSQDSLELIESLKKDAADISSQLVKTQELLKTAKEERITLQENAAKTEKELKEKNKELSSEIQQLSRKLSSSQDESSALKQEIEKMKSEILKTKEACEGQSSKLKILEDEVDAYKKKSLEDDSALEDLTNRVESLKKDKSNLKEQVAKYKSDASRFEEIEQALSQELAVLRNKLDQKNKAVSDLEKELAESKAKATEIEKPAVTGEYNSEVHIDFLNSIITDLQNKNKDLETKINVLMNGGSSADANSNRVGGGEAPKTLQSLRPYCDICETFDTHDTEDCPAQQSEDNNTHYGAVRGEPRPYCETCEIFGHATGECDDQETY